MIVTSPVEVVQTLAMALIASSDAPLLLLTGDLTVVAASASFCAAFDIAPKVAGRALAELGAGEWNTPQLRSLLRSTASGHAAVDGYEMDLRRAARPDRKLILTAKRLAYDGGDVRLLLTASDITEARLAEKLKDDLVREQAIMLQELQHRVANSLQIIASVLMQSASRVQSEEARGHLHDAHSRVMSIAKVQQHLAATRLGDVELRAYFTALCDSISASMIHNSRHLLLTVTSDDSRVKADVSVSLGLIVTELVINALKHGFPEGRGGTIKVDYHARGDGWTLSVTDDGIGMTESAESATPGLGMGIIEALSKRLGATIRTSNANPGMAVSIDRAAGPAQATA